MNSGLSAELGNRGIAPDCIETIAVVRDILARIGDRWTLLIVSTLSTGPVRFSTLHQRVAGVSHRMLVQTLRSLTRDGLIKRVASPTGPRRVEYELTDLGKSLARAVDQLVDWVRASESEIARNRDAFDSLTQKDWRRRSAQ